MQFYASKIALCFLLLNLEISNAWKYVLCWRLLSLFKKVNILLVLFIMSDKFILLICFSGFEKQYRWMHLSCNWNSNTYKWCVPISPPQFSVIIRPLSSVTWVLTVSTFKDPCIQSVSFPTWNCSNFSSTLNPAFPFSTKQSEWSWQPKWNSRWMCRWSCGRDCFCSCFS